MKDCMNCGEISGNIEFEDGDITRYYCNSCGYITVTFTKLDSKFVNAKLGEVLKRLLANLLRKIKRLFGISA